MEKYYYQIRNLLVNGESFNLAIFICFLILLIYIFVTIYKKISYEYDIDICDKKIATTYCIYIQIQIEKFFKKLLLIIFFSLVIDLKLGWTTFDFIREYSIIILGFVIFIHYINFNYYRKRTNNFKKSEKLINPDFNPFAKEKNENEIECNSNIISYETDIKRTKLQLELLKHFIGSALFASIISLLTNYFGEKGLPDYITEIMFIVSIIVLMCFWCTYKKMVEHEFIKSIYKDALYIIKNAIRYTEQERMERQRQKLMEVNNMKLNNKINNKINNILKSLS